MQKIIYWYTPKKKKKSQIFFLNYAALTERNRDRIKWKEIFDSQSFKDKKQAEKTIKMHARVTPCRKERITQRAELEPQRKTPRE